MRNNITVCVPIRCTTFEEVVNSAKKSLLEGADMVEVWLDSLPFTYDVSRKDQKLLNELFSLIDLPILCVNKGDIEHGSFDGSEEARVGLLCKAVIAGVDFVDIGIHTSKDLVQNLKNVIEENGGITQIIISYHNFEKTPLFDELKAVVQTADELGADIIKISTYATEESDNDVIFAMLDLIHKEGKKGIGVCMGENGARSRIDSHNHGSQWTYAALDEDSKTATGQITINELHG
ncbi:MAG: type I 3-dehydroquinate dehydratase [Candidatus Peregrinibacteria bacterium]|nr:type I 3-dehydroquinate dehydratase [Candidatus Peregrinibacteria bacterium]MDZ4244440.1 type I 3-dehydroquinate dehydratase [Candidatus Gracilibacteria bacterium]